MEWLRIDPTLFFGLVHEQSIQYYFYTGMHASVVPDRTKPPTEIAVRNSEAITTCNIHVHVAVDLRVAIISLVHHPSVPECGQPCTTCLALRTIADDESLSICRSSVSQI